MELAWKNWTAADPTARRSRTPHTGPLQQRRESHGAGLQKALNSRSVAARRVGAVHAPDLVQGCRARPIELPRVRPIGVHDPDLGRQIRRIALACPLEHGEDDPPVAGPAVHVTTDLHRRATVHARRREVRQSPKIRAVGAHGVDVAVLVEVLPLPTVLVHAEPGDCRRECDRRAVRRPRRVPREQRVSTS